MVRLVFLDKSSGQPLLRLTVSDGQPPVVEGEGSWLDFRYLPYSARLGRTVSYHEHVDEWARSLADAYSDSAYLVRIEHDDQLQLVSSGPGLPAGDDGRRAQLDQSELTSDYALASELTAAGHPAIAPGAMLYVFLRAPLWVAVKAFVLLLLVLILQEWQQLPWWSVIPPLVLAEAYLFYRLYRRNYIRSASSGLAAASLFAALVYLIATTVIFVLFFLALVTTILAPLNIDLEQLRP